MTTVWGSHDFPCVATGEADVDGATIPVACDLGHGHVRSHWDGDVFTFWGRDHPGREYERADHIEAQS